MYVYMCILQARNLVLILWFGIKKFPPEYFLVQTDIAS